jgi:lantibiotic modifying enzyme
MIRNRFQAEALSIAHQLGEHRLQTSAGTAAWIGPRGYGTDLIPLQQVQLGPHLYDGTAGIALFLAALEHVTQSGEFRAPALEALAPLRRKLAEFVERTERADALRIPVGGLIGLGSFIYTLVKAAAWLQEPALVREAHASTVLITSERIAGDRRVRVQTGSAGAILALLALHAEAPQPNRAGKTPLDLALECAAHILAGRVSFEGRPRAWALSPGKIPLPGFSYGAAGISYALLRLYEATGRAELREAAREGLAFVRGLYAPEHGGWRDIRAEFEARYRPRRGTWKDWWAQGTLDDLEEVTPRALVDQYLDGWCHGSAGIALGRLGALHLEDGPEVREEIGRTLEKVRLPARLGEVAASGPDDLCCGHMGRIELLLYSHGRIGDEDALAAANRLMAGILDRARREGGFQVSAARGTQAFAPMLFQGIAGIGYTLLRLAAPDALPCLLLLE